MIIIVADSLGVGELPDAAAYGDEGSDTLGNTALAVGGLDLPNLEAMGLGNIGGFKGIRSRPDCGAAFGKMAEASPGKDTMTGHWEMTGVLLDGSFPLYPDGFPDEVTDRFRAAIGTDILGNRPASGTQIIDEYGPEHMRTGYPIVYTSGDSVFQIAAHKSVIPLARLYDICAEARSILSGPHAVGRVIARPFVGEPGEFMRTYERRDFSMPPPEPTLLDEAKDAGLPVVGIGKIEDIFSGRGLTDCIHSDGNADGMAKTEAALEKYDEGIIFTNLVDFDTMYGHRNDPEGYYSALREFDSWLPKLLSRLSQTDLLFITGDHGCDPTTPSTDHSREYVPLLVYRPGVTGGVDLGVRRGFFDLGATAAEALGLHIRHGESFLRALDRDKR